MFCSVFKKTIATTLVLAVLCTVGVCASAKQPEYSEYIAQTDTEAFEEKVKVDADLSLVGEHSTVGTPAADAVVIKDTVQFDVAVESSGIYNIKLCYVILSENAEKAEYSLLIDGELPFAEAETLGLNTEYVRINEQILTDKLGNELTPQLKKSDSWINAYLKDASGYQNEPYAFYLSEGAHSIKFTVTDGVLALKEFSLIGVTPRPTYKEYIKKYAGAKNGEYSAFYEAENPVSRTSQAIIEACDNSTAAVSPGAQRLTVMNHLGGEAWSMPMQAASWKISVPEDGLYTVSLRYRQNFTNGIYTTRRIYIDGEIPFDELSRVQFPYTADWKSITVGEGEAPYQIYLTAGEHIITAEASLGDMSEIVTKANAIILKLNGIYLGLLLGTIIFSVAAGLSEVLLSPLVAAIPSPTPDRDMSFLHSLYAYGVLSVVIISSLYFKIFGIENWVYLVLFFSVLPVISSILFTVSPLPQMNIGGEVEKNISHSSHKGIMLCTLCIFLGSAAENTMTTWISSFMESALNISKAVGDIIGLAIFAILLGLGRTLYAKYGKNISNVLFFGMLGASICYITIGLVNNVIISAFACVLTGICTSMLWPGTLILMEEKIPNVGVAAYALMAAGGDFGGSVAPQMLGIVVDKVSKSGWASNISDVLSITAEQLGMKIGMLTAAIFPLLGVVLLSYMKKYFKK